MILKPLFVLLFGAHISWAAPQVTTTLGMFDTTSKGSDLGFREDYKYEPETETYYKEHVTLKSWFKAVATCKSEGAKLAAPFTKIEADVVQKHISGKCDYTWLGIHDLFKEGKFITLNGTRATDIYTDWTTGEPNNAGGDEHCVTMTKAGKYNDAMCSLETTFICSKRQPFDPRTTPNDDYVTKVSQETTNIPELFDGTLKETTQKIFDETPEETTKIKKVFDKTSEETTQKIFDEMPEETTKIKEVFDESLKEIIKKIFEETPEETTKIKKVFDKTLEETTQKIFVETPEETTKIKEAFDETSDVTINTNDKKPEEITKRNGILNETSNDLFLKFIKDYKYETKTEMYYKEHTTPKNWSGAIAACKMERAKLAVPFTKTEADIVQKHFSGKSYYTWLGIHDLFAEGKFLTLNGTRAADIYADWNPDEPNNAGGDEDCVTMNRNGKYNDVPCDILCTFVCTKHRSEIILNNEMLKCETTDKDYFFEAETERCYKIHATPMTWHEAYSTCENEEATLAMANSRTEVDLFKKYLAEYPDYSLKGNFVTGEIFLDFTDLITRGQFLTSNGETLQESGYSAWPEGQPGPGDLDDEEHCGSMRRDGKLSYLSCNDKALFVCEKTLKSSSQLTDADEKDKGHYSFFSAFFYYFENI